MADDQHVGMVDLSTDVPLLGALDEMVQQDGEASMGLGVEGSNRSLEIVRSVEGFDHDADAAQIVAPDLLDQFGVMYALDPDSAGPGNPCPLAGDGN